MPSAPAIPSAKSVWYPHLLLFGGILALALPCQARAMRPAVLGSSARPYLQESGAGAPLGKLYVAPEVMGKQCILMVSPAYPLTNGDSI